MSVAAHPTESGSAAGPTDSGSAAGRAETVDEFRLRARAWLAESMPRRADGVRLVDSRDDQAAWDRAKELQRRLYDGGLAGVCFPREYGGLGLDRTFQRALDEETLDYEMPLLLNVPTFAICAATILDMGSEEQKRERISAAIRGEEILVQLLSEPSGGSDLAGVITRAERDGDEWILNGAKTWSTSAFAADYGLCLARTNWDVPKHQGLTMFLVPIDTPGITIRRITQINGSTEFCEEYFDDVRLPAGSVVGEVDDGWAVASRQLHHERRAVGNASEFASGIAGKGSEVEPVDFYRLLHSTGQDDDPTLHALIGRALVRRLVNRQLIDRVNHAMADGSMPPASGSILRIFSAETNNLDIDTALAVTGTDGVIGDDGDDIAVGVRYLSRQGVNLGGGTTEISRNIVSERVLQMPRERADDRGVPFRDVKRNSLS